MKISKTLLSGLLAVGLAASASAQTYVHIMGSTAFRAAVSQSIVDDMNQNAATTGSATIVYFGSSFRGANEAIISGTLPVVGWTVVETYWTGSASGDIDVALQNVQHNAFPSLVGNITDSSTNFLGSVVSGSYNASALSSPTSVDVAAPDVAMSDVYVGSVIKELSDVTVTGSSAAAVISSMTQTNSTLNDAGTSGLAGGAGAVAAIPFEWVVGSGTSEHAGQISETASNITSDTAKQLISAGWVQFSQLSGNTADSTNFAVLVGRSEDSGTRIGSFAFAFNGENDGFDVTPVQAEVVYANPTVNGTAYAGVSVTGAFENVTASTNGYYCGGVSGTIGKLVKFPTNNPLNTETAFHWSGQGHSGYINGGDVATTLESYNGTLLGTADNTIVTTVNTGMTSTVLNSATTTLIGYLGLSDAASAISKGCHALTYNGVPYSAAAVESGQYAAWGYEHMYYQHQLAIQSSNPVKQAIDSIADYIYQYDADINKDDGDFSHGGTSSSNAASGVLLSNMKVVRTAQEGGGITP
jgi:hypothetical protein